MLENCWKHEELYKLYVHVYICFYTVIHDQLLLIMISGLVEPQASTHFFCLVHSLLSSHALSSLKKMQYLNVVVI